MKKILFGIIFFCCCSISAFSQSDILSSGRISGNFQLEAQSYAKDSLIEAPGVSEKILSNGFLNLNYSNGNFSAGLRYEAYYNPILGIDPRFKGSGISYRYGRFANERLDVTVGDFYEQFGSGIILRAYEERALGLDNAIDGARLKYKPAEGINITGLIGKQRNFWDKGEGIIRAADIDININELFNDLLANDMALTTGFSVVSKYQDDKSPIYKLPKNVFAYSYRLGLSGSFYSIDGEYAYKINDPSVVNKMTYNNGDAVTINASIFSKGLSLNINAHRIDNMNFRGDRNATGNAQIINFVPPITRQHAYKLATMFPYSTQINGEIGFQTELNYKFDNNGFFGKYGPSITVNYSRINNIDTTSKTDKNSLDGKLYDSKFFSFGDRMFFQDFNIYWAHKINSDFKYSFSFINLNYDKDVMEYEWSGKFGKVKSNIIVLDGTYKLNDANAIRLELQHMWSTTDSTLHAPNNNNGNWMMFLGEYTISPGWFFTVFDEYNYGNEYDDYKLHYPSASVAYIYETTRLQLSYGRQRGGILCVGGVCRTVPASNGFYLSITSSF